MYCVASAREVSLALFIYCSISNAFRYGFIYDNYTSLWNVLDYCATTVPVMHVSPSEDVKGGYQCRNETEAKIWSDCKYFIMHSFMI